MRKPLSPLQAFAEDARNGVERAFDAGDALVSWLSIAQAADTLSELRVSDRAEALHRAQLLLEPFAAARPTMVHDAKPAPTDEVEMLAEQFRVAAETMEQAGCFQLAYSIVSSVCRLTAPGDYVASALAVVHLGRIARQMNDLPTAEDCYQSMLQTSTRKRDSPLAARGHIGLALLHDMRGNIPAAEAGYLKALELAIPKESTFAAACQGLMTIAIDAGRLAEALTYGWRFYDATESDRDSRAAALSDLASVAMRSGFAGAAFKGYQQALTLSGVPRIRMVILAGAVRAAARLGLTPRVREFDSELLNEIARANLPHTASMSLLYSAEAWGLVNEAETANARLAECLALASRFGYHEYEFKAESLAAEWERARTRREPMSATLLEPVLEGDRSDVRVSTSIARLELLAV